MFSALSVVIFASGGRSSSQGFSLVSDLQYEEVTVVCV